MTIHSRFPKDSHRQHHPKEGGAAVNMEQVRVHNWIARIDRLPTLINLAKRGIIIDSNSCPLCLAYPETGAHIFLECRLTGNVRKAINFWWKVFPERCSSMEEYFVAGRTANHDIKNTVIKEAIFHAFTWAIWKGRNDVVFNRKPFNPLLIANFIQTSVFSWVCNRSEIGRNRPWLYWICNPRSF